MKAKNADDRGSGRRPATSVTRPSLIKRTERAYRAALERLVQGKATHPKYAGRPVKITPGRVRLASVAILFTRRIARF
jgi:hypothetical protein